jgi:hypothetical protein
MKAYRGGAEVQFLVRTAKNIIFERGKANRLMKPKENNS